MTIVVRSIDGNFDTNSTSPTLDSPGTIVIDDLLAASFISNQRNVTTITPPTGWSEEANELSDSAQVGMTVFLFSKRAVQFDVDNQGSLDFYAFAGFNGAEDALGICFACHDDVSGLAEIKSGSFAHDTETDDDTTTTAPSQIIGVDTSMTIAHFFNHDTVGAPGKIRTGTGFTPTGASNIVEITDDAAVRAVAMSGMSSLAFSMEFDISDSPTGGLVLTHTDLDNSPEGQLALSFTIQRQAAAAASPISAGGIIVNP